MKRDEVIAEIDRAVRDGRIVGTVGDEAVCLVRGAPDVPEVAIENFACILLWEHCVIRVHDGLLQVSFTSNDTGHGAAIKLLEALHETL